MFVVEGAEENHCIVTGNILVVLWSFSAQAGLSTVRQRYEDRGHAARAVLLSRRFSHVRRAEVLAGRRDILLNPVIIVEVLSKSTQRYDREIKLKEYQRIATVDALLLASSERPAVDLHTRAGRAWKHHTFSGLDKLIAPFAEMRAGARRYLRRRGFRARGSTQGDPVEQRITPPARRRGHQSRHMQGDTASLAIFARKEIR
jgi:Putative restriction endonuclease